MIPKSTLKNPIPCQSDWNEGKYNEEFAKTDKSYYLFDKQNYQGTGWGRSKIEPSDIITRKKQFIHVKKGGSSSTLSHLFAQGLVSSQLIKNDEEFITHLNNQVGSNFWNLPLQGTDKIEVVYGIIDRRFNENVSEFLPFFSMVNLSQNYENILNLGYKCSLLPIEQKEGEKLSKKEKKLLDKIKSILKTNNKISAKAILEKLNEGLNNDEEISENSLKRYLNKFVDKGILKKEKDGRAIIFSLE